MLKVNKKVEYALMALKYMALKDGSELTSAREVCDEFGVPFDTIAKVLQTMNTKGYLNSVKGIKGGYSLARDLSEISYIELANIIEGKGEDEHPCQSNKGICELYDNCNIVTPIEQLNGKIKNYLQQLDLQELLLGESILFQTIEKEKQKQEEKEA